MALCHREFPVYGVQFHPESVLTHDGKKILARFLAIEPKACVTRRTVFQYELFDKSLRFWPPLPLLKGERIEVRGSKTAQATESCKPSPTLSQTHSFALTGAGASVSPKGREKGEADQSANPSNTSQTRSMK